MKAESREAHSRHFRYTETLEHTLVSELRPVFYVYVLASETSGKLAVSMAQDLTTRVLNQKNDLHPRDFTSVHAIHTLVRVEDFTDLCAAIERYNELRRLDLNSLSWLVEKENPDWSDLFDGYLDPNVSHYPATKVR